MLKDGELVDTRPIDQLDRPTLVELMVGRPLAEIFPQTDHEQGELVLVAENISTDTILEDASLELYQGEILGIAGMVGSGRTELARALFGADPLTSGEITLASDKAQAGAIRRRRLNRAWCWCRKTASRTGYSLHCRCASM